MKKSMKVALVASSRMPNNVECGIFSTAEAKGFFGELIDSLDTKGQTEAIEEFIDSLDTHNLDVYLNGGPTTMIISVVNACRNKDVNLTTYHFFSDGHNGHYFPQKVD